MSRLIVRFTERDKDSRSALIVEHDGAVLFECYDGGEPEDNYYFRDWGWVAEAIEKAYALGLEDGRTTHTDNAAPAGPIDADAVARVD